MKPEEVLSLEFESSDIDELVTLKEYLKELLCSLWIEGEDFSGKRPLGTSGWQFTIYDLLVKRRLACDNWEDVDKVMTKAIRSL